MSPWSLESLAGITRNVVCAGSQNTVAWRALRASVVCDQAVGDTKRNLTQSGIDSGAIR
jgi:hypothetical protein